MEIRCVNYDREADELDLLIDSKKPIAAEAVAVGNGIYIRCDPCSGRVVGAFVRGYSRLLGRLRSGGEILREEGVKPEHTEILQAILDWIASGGSCYAD